MVFCPHIFQVLIYTTCIISVYSGIFNIDLLSKEKHQITLINEPYIYTEDQIFNDNSIKLTNKNGLPFICHIPDIKVEDESDEASHDVKGIITNESVQEIIKKVSASKQLFENSFPRQDCYYYSIGNEWWSYEICIGEEIRQFHTGLNSQLESISSLGVFEEDFDWEDNVDTDLYAKLKREKAHAQNYTDGSNCDITSEPRATQLLVRCFDSSMSTKVISVQETSTCQYEIVFHTPHLCKHHEFVPLEDVKARSKKNVHETKCQKLVTQQEFELWKTKSDINMQLNEDVFLQNIVDNKNALTTEAKRDLTSVGRSGKPSLMTSSGAIIEDVPAELKSVLKNFLQKEQSTAASTVTKKQAINAEIVDMEGNVDNTLDNTGIPSQMEELKRQIAQQIQEQHGDNPEVPQQITIKVINVNDDGRGGDMPQISPDQLKMMKNAVMSMVLRESPQKGDDAEKVQTTQADIYNDRH